MILPSLLPPVMPSFVRLAGPQVSAYAYILGMVTIQLALPHAAVFTGMWCRLWQVRAGIGRMCGYMCCLTLHFSASLTTSPLSPQAGVAALAGCMLFTLRGRISGRTVLPSSAGTVAAAFQGPKDH